MIKQKAIVRDLAKKYQLDARVIDKITKSPFLFLRDKIESLEDMEAVRIPYYGVFSFKSNVTQENKQQMLLERAINKLKGELKRLPHDSEYRKGIVHSLSIIKELIEIRKGKPEEYGMGEVEESAGD